MGASTKHTHLEWVKRHSTRKIGAFEICTAEENPTTIALLPCNLELDFFGHANYSEAETNAEIICKAVNNHDKLTEAVKKLKGRIIFLEMATEDKFDLTDFTEINRLIESTK